MIAAVIAVSAVALAALGLVAWLVHHGWSAGEQLVDAKLKLGQSEFARGKAEGLVVELRDELGGARVRHQAQLADRERELGRLRSAAIDGADPATLRTVVADMLKGKGGPS